MYRLSTPKKIQEYINSNLRYNYEETQRSFPDIIENQKGHCFEIAIGFAYPLLYLWGYDPRLAYINAYQEDDNEDHCVIAYRAKTGYGAVGSGGKSMGWRQAEHDSYDQLMRSYYPEYTDSSKPVGYEHVMKGYSDPIDLVAQGGTDWFFRKGDYALHDFWVHCTADIL